MTSERVLDQENRLSHSLLWDLQRNAYCQYGIGAWSKKGVPSYITSNSFTARCYAHTVLGYLKDGLRQNAFDVNHPIYLFDLGAGTGRFAYLFLKELFRLIGDGDLSQFKLCYVMADIAEDNINFWQNHPYLESFYEQGTLDCMKFHHTQDLPFHLIRQNIELSPENVVNPIVVIANYFFDTIPQDLFRVKDGVLEEGKIALSVPKNITADAQDPDIINHLKCAYSYYPLDTLDYYDDYEINEVLEEYHMEFDGTTFLFPIGAFQVIRTFEKLSHGRMLLLGADQGVCTATQVKDQGNPTVSLHGSFSIAVSYHAIGEFIKLLNGKPLITSLPEPIFVVMGAILNQGMDESFYETELAFQEHMDYFEPFDYWKLVTVTEKEWKEPPLMQVLMLIKLGNWDIIALHAFLPIIQKYLPQATKSQKNRIVQTLHRVWENYYPVAAGEESFITAIGNVFLELGLPEEAELYFDRARSISGI